MKKILSFLLLVLVATTLVGCTGLPEDKVMYTVTFNTNEGNFINPAEVEEGSFVSEPTAPEKEGYDFKGWFSDSTLNNAFNFATPVQGNITLHAKWEVAS